MTHIIAKPYANQKIEFNQSNSLSEANLNFIY